MQKQRPILYSTPMVIAVQREVDPKTQTRRTKGLEKINEKPFINYRYDGYDSENDVHFMEEIGIELYQQVKCPYGKVGDLLWVRETTKVGAWDHEENTVAFDYKASPELTKTPWVQFDDDEKFIEFTDRLIKKLDKLGIEPIVDEENECFSYKWEPGQSPFKWTPSIHMPKAAARIWLQITDIKVERLKDISEADAIAEGVEPVDGGYKNYMTEPKMLKKLNYWTKAYFSFLSLWESINGYESSELNPWVWVITFKKVEKP